MRWYKEGKRDSEDADIMSHSADDDAWQTLERLDSEFARTPGVSVLVYQRMVFSLTTPIVPHTLAGQFL
jgi:hypothetical protein